MTPSPVLPLLLPELRERAERGYAALVGAMTIHEKMIKAGTTIVAEDKDHDRSYHLESGWVARTRFLPDGDRAVIMTFLPQDVFGIKCMLLEKQPDSIIALSDAQVRSLSREKGLALADSDPDVALFLMFQLGEDERRLHNWVAALGRPALERVSLLLIEFTSRLHRLGLLKGDSFRLPMTQQDIGDSVGLSPVHVNRTIRELRDREILSIDRRMVTIYNIERLRNVAYPLLDVFERDAREFRR